MSGHTKLGSVCLLICTFLLLGVQNCKCQSTMMPWVTRSGDNSRSGWNSRETQLTQASLASKRIVRATIIPVIGDARGMEAQPLILPNVSTARGKRDVLVLPSMGAGEKYRLRAREHTRDDGSSAFYASMPFYLYLVVQ